VTTIVFEEIRDLGQVDSGLAAVIRHYESHWNAGATLVRMTKGPVGDLPPQFVVAELRRDPDSWAYATVGLSFAGRGRFEVFILSATQDRKNVELLYALSHFHITGEPLGFGHTVNLGRSLVAESPLEYGLLSAPYMEPEGFDVLSLEAGEVWFAWLLPITEAERDFKIAQGIEALENALEAARVDYLNPFRPSVV
jgi:hypothetical protein